MGRCASSRGGARDKPPTPGRYPPQPYAPAHFATFPEELVLSCIAAGSSEHGVCPGCGAPWRRIVERHRLLDGDQEIKGDFSRPDEPFRIPANGVGRYSTRTTAIGWQPTCTHDYTPVLATILDPFAGSGTTLAVARRMGRRAVGVELQPSYLNLIKARVEAAALPLVEEASAPDAEAKTVQTSLFEVS